MNRTGIIYHEDYLKHDPGRGHPECPDRLKETMKYLREIDLPGTVIENHPAEIDDL